MAWNPEPVPLKYRIAIGATAVLLGLSMLEIWAGGVRFMKLVTKVATDIAAHEEKKQAAQAPPAEIETPGVVHVGILPPDKKR
jgi:hypothetical protein